MTRTRTANAPARMRVGTVMGARGARPCAVHTMAAKITQASVKWNANRYCDTLTDSVSRVAPPTVSVTNIKAATANSQSLMARRRVSERGASRVMRSLGCRRRCGPYSRAGTAAIERGHAHPSTQVRRCDHADRARGRRALMPMAFAQSPQVKANGTIEVIYYVVPGLGWVLPTTPQHRRDQQLCFAGSSATPAVSIPE